MNIIPQNFINVLKNEIKNVINDKIDAFVDNIADIFNSNNSLDKYSNIFITADKTAKEIILNGIKTLLENIDNRFKHSDLRLKNYVINKSNVSRTITTIFGDLTFCRTYYQSRFDKSLHFLLDESLELEKYDKYDHLVKDVKNPSKSRRKLLNRLVFSTYNKNAWGEYVNWLYKIYDSEKIKTIYLMSDGGTWIKTGIDELKTNPNQVIKRLLCEFHLKQAINRMTTDKDFREIINISFKEDKKKDFISLTNNLLIITPDKKNTIEKNINYISKNYKAMKDMVDFEIGSSMESHISHCIASYFASRPKGYSSLKISKYLKINDYNNNNINILNLYLKSYNKSNVITINSDSIHIFDYKQSSNMPILYSNNVDIKTLFDLNKIKTANVII